MRTIYTVLAIIMSILFLGCSNDIEPTTHHISVAVDLTEAEPFAFSSKPIINQLGNTPLHDGITLSLIPITDTRYANKQSFVLPHGETGLMANEDERRNKRRALFKTFNDSLAVLNTNVTEHKRSDIFRVIAKELNELSSKTGKRSLVISSDLQSHNDFFSVYNKSQLQLLYNNPSGIKKRFESATTLADNLHGITVVIAYSPTLEDEKLFSSLVALYTSILEPRGAIVRVGYDNTITI